MDSKEIIWQYDDIYYLGGVSKHNGKKIKGVFGSVEFNKGHIAGRKIASANLANFKNKTILDVGYARGEVLKYCFDNNAKLCVGIDYSPNSYNIAKKYINNSKVKLYELAITDIDKVKETGFEVLYLIDIFEHVSTDEWNIFFKKIHTKLHQDCILIGETPCYKHGGYMSMHNNYFTEDGLNDLLEQYFKDINIEKRDVHCKKFLKGKPLDVESATHFIIKAKGLK